MPSGRPRRNAYNLITSPRGDTFKPMGQKGHIMKNTTTTNAAAFSMTMFNKLETALKHGETARFEEAYAFAAIIDAAPAEAKKLRARFGEECVTKKAALASIYAAHGKEYPKRSEESRLLYVGRYAAKLGGGVYDEFDGLAYRAAAALIAGLVTADATPDALRTKVKEWRAAHPAVVTVKGIEEAFPKKGGKSDGGKSDGGKSDGKSDVTQEGARQVEKARKTLQTVLADLYAQAVAANDLPTVKKLQMAIDAAATLGAPIITADAPVKPAPAKDSKDAAKRAKKTKAAKSEAIA